MLTFVAEVGEDGHDLVLSVHLRHCDLALRCLPLSEAQGGEEVELPAGGQCGHVVGDRPLSRALLAHQGKPPQHCWEILPRPGLARLGPIILHLLAGLCRTKAKEAIEAEGSLRGQIWLMGTLGFAAGGAEWNGIKQMHE